MKSPVGTKFQIAIVAEPSDRIQTLGTIDTIEWLWCRRVGEHVFEFRSGDVIVTSVDLEKARFELHNLVGVIVAGDADSLDTIKSAWTSRLPIPVIAFRRVAECEPESILRAAFECMTEDLALQRWNSGRAALDLATYRREFERLQRSFVRLEEHVGRQSLLGATEIFEYPPDSVVVTRESAGTRFGDALTSGSLTQYVPVDSFGFSSFSIYISVKPDVASEPLRIMLKAVETDHLYGVWSLSAAETHAGWIELALEYAIDESALSLVIIVEWPCHTSGWTLALGPPHPYREFSASTDGRRYLAAPLALRVFSRLPGVRVQATTSTLRPADAPHALTRFIPYEAYATVAQVFPRPDNDVPALVFYDPNIGCITVHPRKGGMTTAGRLTVFVPKHAWRISAQIHLAHAQASPTQFALLVRTPDERTRELETLDGMNTASPGFSGWRTLAPLEQRNISALIASPHDGQLLIYLVTRQHPDSSPDFGWARFTRFEFNILPASLISGHETGALAAVLRTSVPSAEDVHRQEEPENTELGVEPNARSV